MQGMTRNPLADPGLLGLSAGANAALAITIAFIPSANYFGIMIACFIGAAVGTLLVFGIGAMKKGGFSPLRIVLAGSAISAFSIRDRRRDWYFILKFQRMYPCGLLED